MADNKPKLPDWDALEKAGSARETAAREAVANPPAEAGGISTGDAAGLGFIDKMSLGLLPALHDKLVDWAPAGHKLGRKYSEIIPEAEQQHPIASTVGGGLGMAMPIGGALRMTQMLKGIPVVGSALQGAAAVGGENVADQAVRTQTEDRPFNPTEAGGAALLGAVNPIGLVAGAGRQIGRLAGMSQTLKGITDAAKSALPEATTAAQRTLAADAVDAGAKQTAESIAARAAAKKAVMPGAEDLGAYAPDDPLAEIARMARAGKPVPEPPPLPNLQGIRPSQLQRGTPMYDEVLSRIQTGQSLRPPPVAEPPPPGLVEQLSAISKGAERAGDLWTATSRGAVQSGVRVGSEDKKKARARSASKRYP